MPFLLDLDNTLLPSKSAYKFAMLSLEEDWNQKKMGGDFSAFYEEARNKVKNQLKGHSSNRLRLLCFKIMVENLNTKLNSALIKDVLWLEERYFLHFTEYLKKESLKSDYKDELFPKLVEISSKYPVLLSTNETLRTQFLKLTHFFPDAFNYLLITSEEVGYEKPSTEFFSYVMHKAGNNPSTCFLIGDNWEDDILGASRHGISAIHLKEQFGAKSGVVRLEHPKQNETHPDFDSLTPIFQSSNIIEALDFGMGWLRERQK
jgi:putative hydrolase of the HAD superfamily